jgi:alkylated DNA repair dioxygenase AlkB
VGRVAGMANTRSQRYLANRSSAPVRPQPLAWQPSLLDAGAAPSFDPDFTNAMHLDLGRGAWVEHCPGWVSGAAELFALVVERAPWQRHTVPMYGRMIEEPRLTAWYGSEPGEVAHLDILGGMAAALSERYDRDFDGVGAALYRDGSDSVAWHSDRIPEELIEPVVALVSLGSPRTLRMRPRGGGNGRAFRLQPGDLFVMGGTSQRTWEHGVPKVARAGPRLSLQFRHSH